MRDVTKRIMVDIETLGVTPGSAILSIGAVRFDEDGIGEPYYREISLKSCQDAGLEIDADTLEWWLDQADAVTDVLSGGDPLEEVLEEFSGYYHDTEEIWANSPSFDCALLESAYDAVGLTEPWEFYETRDLRTIRSLPCAVEVEREGVAHNALDDARYQARVVYETLQAIDDQEEDR